MNRPGPAPGNGAKALYRAKHAFSGNAAQSQLTFAAGASIAAATNQGGAWWWGNCNGKVRFSIVVVENFVNIIGAG